MSCNCRYSVMIVACLVAAGCGGRHRSSTSPNDPFTRIPVSQLPVASASGSNVLLLAVGGLVLGDTTPLPELEGRRSALLATANAVLDSVLRESVREVAWQGLDEQRGAARRNPTLGLAPDRFATAYVIGSAVAKIPDPLWGQVRTLAAITSARFAVIPAGARLTRANGADGGYRAEYVLVTADTRSGAVLWRGRAVGRAAATPEAALASAAATVIASPLQSPPVQPRP